MSDEKKITIEERFANLDSIVRQMEGSTITLDQSFALYQQGLEEIKACNQMLDGMEQAMLVLNGNGELEEF